MCSEITIYYVSDKCMTTVRKTSNAMKTKHQKVLLRYHKGKKKLI